MLFLNIRMFLFMLFCKNPTRSSPQQPDCVPAKLTFEIRGLLEKKSTPTVSEIPIFLNTNLPQDFGVKTSFGSSEYHLRKVELNHVSEEFDDLFE